MIAHIARGVHITFPTSSNWKHTIYLKNSTLTRFNFSNVHFSTREVLEDHVAEEPWKINLSGRDESVLQGNRGDWWWTGKEPNKLSNLHRLNGTTKNASSMTSLLQPTLLNIQRKTVAEYFDNSWTLTELLFSGLQGEEAFFRPPYHALRHPLIFYYGHPACLYINKMRVAGLLDRGVNEEYEHLFEVGVDEMRWDDLSKCSKLWPSVKQVHSYRKAVYDVVSEAICNVFPEDGTEVTMKDPRWSILMGIEHERIHLETSSVLFRELPVRLLRKPDLWPCVHESPLRELPLSTKPTAGKDYPENVMLPVNGGELTIGKASTYPAYGWDNEYGTRTLNIKPFKASKFMVSNGEFYEFVVAGGYREQKHWCEEGWKWRCFRNTKWPTFWVQDGPSGIFHFKLRCIFEEVTMQWDWPVLVNHYEAVAFTNWKSTLDKFATDLRLLTEGEHHMLREENMRGINVIPSDDPALDSNASHLARPTSNHYNYNLISGSETPVDAGQPNSNGFYDVMGNAWERGLDHFNPLEGFEIHPYYDDFSTPCFDGQHHMIFGGSFASTGALANLHCRTHFRPHFFQHCGFRYVAPNLTENIAGEGLVPTFNKQTNLFQFSPLSPLAIKEHVTETALSDLIYEKQSTLDQYMALHFGQEPENSDLTIIPHSPGVHHSLRFPQRCAQLLVEALPEKKWCESSRALDIGCAVGGSSFELAKTFGTVIGLDYSQAFIDRANQVKNYSNPILFQVPMEGKLKSAVIEAKIDPSIDRSKVSFIQGDATQLNLEQLGGQFDAVLMANLLCRLSDPLKCLSQMQHFVSPGGILAIVSPYSWLEEFTRPEKWLCNGTMRAQQAIQEHLRNNGFKFVVEKNMPLIIREHERKYQYIVSHGQVFIRQEN